MIKISRILHAGYLFEHENHSIVFDPIFENPFSKNCFAFPSIDFNLEKIRQQKFDAVFISHFHDDHCSLESLDLIAKETPIYLYCLSEELYSLLRQLGFQQVLRLELDQPVSIGPFEIIPRRALDWEIDTIFQLRIGLLNILNVVDAWIDPSTLGQLKAEPPWDLVLWPFQTMRELEVISPNQHKSEPAPPEIPREWLEQLKELNPRRIVPSSCQFRHESWSWYNQAFFPITYDHFEKQISKLLPNTLVLRMNPGVSLFLTDQDHRWAEPLPWIIPVGEQNLDYQFESKVEPQTTGAIAKKFPALNPFQTERVFNFCLVDIVTQLNAMGPCLEPYFTSHRIWELSVYNHQGEVQKFYYRLSNTEIQRLSLSEVEDADIGWSTELPLCKLYGALEEGETLTSMYVRINAFPFRAEIEAQLKDCDILEDPLLRCLFQRSAFDYQRAQLQRILLRRP